MKFRMICDGHDDVSHRKVLPSNECMHEVLLTTDMLTGLAEGEE